AHHDIHHSFPTRRSSDLKGIVMIEPQDPISRMPFLLFVLNTFSSYKLVVDRIWKNRFSYEAVGNFVYKTSEREFEKFAAGLNLRSEEHTSELQSRENLVC